MKPNQKAIDEQEQKTRDAATELFKEYGATFIKHRHIQAHTDMLVDIKGYQFNVEIKLRNCKSTDYEDMLLTDLKCFHLFTDYKYRLPLYLVFYEDCTYVWDLSNICIKDLKRITLKSNKVTMADNIIKVNREFLLLPLSKGKKINYIIKK